MHTSDSEYSDLDQADCGLEHSDVDDLEWSLTNGRRRRAKKRNSNSNSHFNTSSHPISLSVTEGLYTRTSDGEESTVSQKSAPAICCSCSKKSSCKTMRCECRDSEGNCGTSCGCDPVRCSNRESALTQEDNDFQPSEIVELIRTASEICEAERSHILAFHGAMLLQSALSDKPVITNDEGGTRRKPLSDIGNTLVCLSYHVSCYHCCVIFVVSRLFSVSYTSRECVDLSLGSYSALQFQAKSNAPKPIQREKWRKSTIQLVPAPPLATEPKNVEGFVKQEVSLSESDVSLKLPRFMHSAVMQNNPLRERNSDLHSDSAVIKDIGATASRSLQERSKATDENENSYKP